MYRSSIIFCIVVLMTLVGINCRKAQESQASEKRGSLKAETAKGGTARAVVRRPISSVKLSGAMRELMAMLRDAQSAYKRAYKDGKIRSWTAYHEAQASLGKARKMFAHISGVMKKQDPATVMELGRSLRGMQLALKKKSHPQLLGQMAYGMMHRTQQVPEDLKSALLGNYKMTMEAAQKVLMVERVVGEYRVGLWLEPVRSYYRWNEVRRSRRLRVIRPPAKARWIVGVLLRDARSGAPLYGTDVSVELLGAKGRQESTTRLLSFWKGFPSYIGYIAAPKGSKVTLQVSISPFPVKRTFRSRTALLRRAVVHFPAKWKGGILQFAAGLSPGKSEVSGMDVLAAASLVGGQMKEGGPYRVGIALVPRETLWGWSGGRPVAISSRAYKNTHMVVFVQDLRTGMLVANARIKVYLYHRQNGQRYRSNYFLQPVYDGFSGYRVALRLKQNREYLARVQISPALDGRFRTRLPLNYSIEFPGLRSSVPSAMGTSPAPKR